jgi:hypothetical protein
MRAPRPAGRPHPVDPKPHSNRAEDTIQDNSGRRRPHNRERSSHEGASDPPSARFQNLGMDRSRPACRPIVIPRLLPGCSARPGDESQSIDPFQDRCEQPPRHGHLGHLERHGSTLAESWRWSNPPRNGTRKGGLPLSKTHPWIWQRAPKKSSQDGLCRPTKIGDSDSHPGRTISYSTAAPGTGFRSARRSVPSTPSSGRR